jgi:hypothetical protein
MKLQQFNGGLSTRLHPSYIQQNEAVVYTNVDSAPGPLKSLKAALLTDIAVKQDHVYFNSEEQWLDYDVRTYTTEFQNKLYSCDGLSRPQKYDGSNKNNIGLAAPTTKMIATPELAPSPVTVIDVKPTVSIVTTALRGTVAYYYVVKVKDITGTQSGAMFIKANSDGTTEILATAATDERTPSVTDDSTVYMQVVLARALAIGAGETVHIFRLYKGKYRRISVFSTEANGFTDAVYDISAQPELDFTKFASVYGKIQYVTTFYDSVNGVESGPSPVSDEIDCTIHGATELLLASLPTTTEPLADTLRIYRIGDQLTNFSLATTAPLPVATWVDFDNIDGRILGTSGYDIPANGLKYITEAYAMLFGAVGSKLYFTPIGIPDAWPTLFFLDFSFDITGIAPTASGLIVMGKYSSDIVLGTGPTSFSRHPLAGDQGCLAHESIQLMGNSAIWMSADGVCVSNGGPVEVISKVALGKFNIVPVDSALHDQIYYAVDETGLVVVADLRFGLIFRYIDADVERLVVGADTLYGWKGGRLYSMFASQDDLLFKYKSPLFIEGRVTQNKYIKNIYIYVNGDIIIRVYIDDELVITKQFVGRDNFQLKVPSKHGHDVQFEVEGRGEVREIYYELGAGDV